MKILSKKWYGVPVVVFVLVAVLGIASIAWAATTITHKGSVTVAGGGGGIPGPSTTYTYALYDAATEGTELANLNETYFALGNVGPTLQTTKKVYVQATGTGEVTVMPLIEWTGTQVGEFTLTPTSVKVVPGGPRQEFTFTFVAGAQSGSGTFDVTYTGQP